MRNMALAIKRPAYRNRGTFFTEYAIFSLCSLSIRPSRYAVLMRCARSDQSTCTITLHYLSNGAMRLRVSIRKQEFMIPLVIILKALQSQMSDRELYTRVASNTSSGITNPQIECQTRRSPATNFHIYGCF